MAQPETLKQHIQSDMALQASATGVAESMPPALVEPQAVNLVKTTSTERATIQMVEAITPSDAASPNKPNRTKKWVKRGVYGALATGAAATIVMNPINELAHEAEENAP